MNKNLKSVFYDDPEVLQMLELKEQSAMVKELYDLKMLEKDEPELQDVIVRFIKGEKGDKGDTGDQGEPGRDGIDGINGLDGKDGRNSIDGINGIDGKPGLKGDKGDKGVDAKDVNIQEMIDAELVKKIISIMRTLPEKDRLDISQIRNANSFMKDGIKYKIEELMHGGGSGGATGALTYSYDISSQFDGVTQTFTLPTYASILQVTITGWPPEGALRPTTDYTTPTSTTITISTSAPIAGTTGIVLYTV